MASNPLDKMEGSTLKGDSVPTIGTPLDENGENELPSSLGKRGLAFNSASAVKPLAPTSQSGENIDAASSTVPALIPITDKKRIAAVIKKRQVESGKKGRAAAGTSKTAPGTSGNKKALVPVQERYTQNVSGDHDSGELSVEKDDFCVKCHANYMKYNSKKDCKKRRN